MHCSFFFQRPQWNDLNVKLRDLKASHLYETVLSIALSTNTDQKKVGPQCILGKGGL